MPPGQYSLSPSTIFIIYLELEASSSDKSISMFLHLAFLWGGDYRSTWAEDSKKAPRAFLERRPIVYDLFFCPLCLMERTKSLSPFRHISPLSSSPAQKKYDLDLELSLVLLQTQGHSDYGMEGGLVCRSWHCILISKQSANGPGAVDLGEAGSTTRKEGVD